MRVAKIIQKDCYVRLVKVILYVILAPCFKKVHIFCFSKKILGGFGARSNLTTYIPHFLIGCCVKKVVKGTQNSAGKRGLLWNVQT